MKQSELFTKTRKEAPADEVSKNAELLIRAGYIHKEMAGVYSLLPLGLKVMNKISGIVREEMNAIGGVEILMSALQDRSVWEKSGRWSDEVVDNWFKSKLKNGGEVGLGFTHEEALARIMSEHVSSYKDLPKYVYQIQTKFRNESRAKSGILRGREFLMKDLYSFVSTQEEHDDFYEKTKGAYKRVFDRAGIGQKTFLTYASGGTFSKYSHEFQTLTEAGEDTIHVCEKCSVAVNEEVINDLSACPECKGKLGDGVKSVEVGNIFPLGTKYAEALGLSFTDEAGVKKSPIMGSYGIGIGRLMGTVAEVYADEKGLSWPSEISPFDVHLISLGVVGEKAHTEAGKMYQELQAKNISVLWDDRDLRAGEKFADSDLIGISKRVVVSDRTLAGDKVEFKERIAKDAGLISQKELFGLFE